MMLDLKRLLIPLIPLWLVKIRFHLATIFFVLDSGICPCFVFMKSCQYVIIKPCFFLIYANFCEVSISYNETMQPHDSLIYANARCLFENSQIFLFIFMTVITLLAFTWTAHHSPSLVKLVTDRRPHFCRLHATVVWPGDWSRSWDSLGDLGPTAMCLLYSTLQKIFWITTINDYSLLTPFHVPIWCNINDYEVHYSHYVLYLHAWATRKYYSIVFEFGLGLYRVIINHMKIEIP